MSDPGSTIEGHADAVSTAGDAVPPLGSLAFFRWIWRTLTSMSTALMLLLLLAVASIPGSIVPQSGVDALKVSNWRVDHPTLAPIMAKLGLFSVYNSPWFSAIYLLLIVSLIGCILPRTAVYLRAWRAAPPRAPARFARLPFYAEIVDPIGSQSDDVLAMAAAELKRRRYRVVRTDDAVSAEKGYLRELGNLVFHISVLIVLVGYAAGASGGYKGGVIVLEGGTFANRLTQYDDFAPGSLFSEGRMEPFAFTVDSFDLDWLATGPAKGLARNFESHLTYTETPGGDEKAFDLQVNHPLRIGGTEIFLIGHGYAPVLTVRDGEGRVVYSGPTIFLPTNPATFESYGVIKVPSAKPGQLAFDGGFYPTYAFTMDTGPMSVFGDALLPEVSLSAYTGDLGLNSGPSQSVYQLRRDGLEPILKPDGKPFRVDLALGETVDLPDGLGSVTFERVERWNRLQISRTPLAGVTLVGVVMALVGLMLSLFIHPSRIWVRRRDGGLELGGLDRSGRSDFDEFDEVRAALSAQKEGVL